jgi:hypothetical protein
LLRGDVTELLRSGFGAPYEEIGQEVYLLDGIGRIDTMWGATVIEPTSDPRRETDDVPGEAVGLERIRQPHVKHLQDELWEMRFSGRDGIGRAIYVTATGRRVVVVHAFVKKTQTTPRPRRHPDPEDTQGSPGVGRTTSKGDTAMASLGKLRKTLLTDPEVQGRV